MSIALRSLRSFPLALTFACVAVACSADTVPPPEPGIATPGSFVAFEGETGKLELVRTVGGAPLDNGDVMMVFIRYAVEPRDFGEAGRLAREPSLPEAAHQYFYEQSRVLARPHEVVWFRTLTTEEIAPRGP